MLARAKPALLLAAGCAGAFLVLLGAAYFVQPARWADGAALQGFLALQRPVTVPVFERLAHLVDPLPYALFALGLLALALAQGRQRHALAAALLLGGAAVSSQLLKPLLAMQRTFDFSEVWAAAFPSGHATASMALALAAVVVAPPAWRPVAAVVGGAFTLAVSFSILALGWHFPSDVAGGYVLAATWALLAVAGLRAVGARPPRARDHSVAVPPAGLAALAVPALVAIAVVGPQAAGYAERHTAFAAVAAGIALTAVTVLGTVTVAARR